jgi:hypothetical protein
MFKISMQRAAFKMNAEELLDLLLDGEYVGWQITRTDNGLEVVGILPNGEYRLLTTIPTHEGTP